MTNKKKSKSTNKKTTAPVKSTPDVIHPDDEIPFGESPTDETKDNLENSAPDETEDAGKQLLEPDETEDAGKQLLELALAAWKVNTSASMTYVLTRCFQCYSSGKEFPTEKVFKKLESLQERLPEELLEKFSKFEEMLISEYDQYVAKRSSSD